MIYNFSNNGIKYTKEQVLYINNQIKNGETFNGTFIKSTDPVFYTLKQISHKIKKLIIIDDVVYGDVEFLHNDSGRLAKEIINNDGYFVPRSINNKIVSFDITVDRSDVPSLFKEIKIKKRDNIIEKILN